jgi:organic radical activating enzyme
VKRYGINEAFYSLQGEGVRAGTANVFLRFAGCNLACTVEEGPKSPGGFDCDTEFAGSRMMTLDEIETYAEEVRDAAAASGPMAMILTGGEPLLQVDREFVDHFKSRGWFLAVETNGSVKPKDGVAERIDWMTCSPKVAEHAIRLLRADELKYVRGHGQALPRPTIPASHYLLSPAFNGLSIDRKALAWCIHLVKQNADWRLSIQNHKAWGVA